MKGVNVAIFCGSKIGNQYAFPGPSILCYAPSWTNRDMTTRFLVDTTMLLSANEIIRPNEAGAQDIESPKAFSALISLVCNRIEVGHLFPGDYNAEHIQIVKMIHPTCLPVNYELHENELDDLYHHSASRFLSYASDANFRLREWLRMQIADPNYERTFFDANEASRKSSIIHSNEILKRMPDYEKVVAEWRSLKVGEFAFVGRHHEEATKLGIYQYLLAYAYFAFVKGPLYATQTHETRGDFKLDYWLMRDGIRLVFDSSSPYPPDIVSSLVFDWGSILLEIYEVSRRYGRNMSVDELSNLISAATEAHSTDILRNGTPHELAEWVVKALIRGGWAPVLTAHGEPKFVKAFSKVSKKLVEVVDHSRVGAIGVDAVTIPLKWDMLAKAKAKKDAKKYQLGEPFKSVYANEISYAIVKFLKERSGA